ncbi:MAG: UDP-3-O-(3-hydroxymyristoyl)glucosamine N-acyltransferase [Limnobacter sp.]|nr:UDP-3-O-(3-hydroxymyristoyl)glucosamine N-acyltransferase [Limnobacter sp.]
MDPLSDPPSLAAVAALIGARILRGDPQRTVHRLATLASAGPDDLSFLSESRYAAQARATTAGAVVARESDADLLPASCAVLAVDDPYRSIAAVARDFAARQAVPPPPGAHPSAVVAPDARIGDGVSIGPQVVIGAGATIGDGVVIGAGSAIGARASIGAGSLLHPRVVVYDACRLGERCIVHSGAVIGADGFGFARAEGGWEKISQLGTVVIGDDVEIGANTTIDRGALDDTVIGNGCKLDNLIQVAHNVRIGEGSALAGCVGIAGSAIIGRRCQIGGGVGIAGHLEICDDVTITGMTLVSHSIRRPGVYSGGPPMMDHPDWQKAAAALRRLPDLRARVRRLEGIAAEDRDPGAGASADSGNRESR